MKTHRTCLAALQRSSHSPVAAKRRNPPASACPPRAGRAPASWAGGILRRFSSLLLLVSLAAGTWSARAASAPPDSMTYQGFLVDGNGNPLATNTPANYPVIFRIYSAATGNARLWSEQQIVTVDKGSFSVVLGEGTAVGGEVRPPLSSIFTGATASDRYIGISVTIGGSTLEILPRLRLLPSAYAFLATSAANLVTPAGSNAISYANNRVEIDGSAHISGNSFPSLTLDSSSSLGTWFALGNSSAGGRYWQMISSGSGNGGGAGNLILATGTSAGGTTGTPLVIQPDGDIGIGTLTPNAPLSFGSGLANTKLALWDGGPGSAFGLGIQASQFRFHVNQSVDRFSFLNGPAGTEVMTIQGGGNVGIGVSTPARRLHVSATDFVAGRIDSSSTIGTWLALGNTSVGGRYWQLISTGSGNGEGAGKLLIGSGGSDGGTGIRMTLQDNGNMGLGVNVPIERLQLGETNFAGDQYLAIKTGGGNQYRAGIKLRHFNEAGGFTIEDDERGAANGLNFIRHPYAGGFSAMFIDRFAGNVGLGTTTPADQLHLRGGILRLDDGGGEFIRMYRSANGLIITGNGLGNAGGTGSSSIQWDGDGNWDVLSDRRLKQDITDAEPVLSRLMQLPVRRYRWKEAPEEPAKKFGVIAQEVEPLFPESVGRMTRPGATEESMTVKYGSFGLIAVKALQELKSEKDAERTALQQEIRDLKKEIESLKARPARTAQMDAMQEELNGLKQMVQQLAAVRRDNKPAEDPSAAAR